MVIADVSACPIADLVSLRGRSAVVTGGATGLGKAMAKRLAEAGAQVLVGDIDFELARTTAAELNVGAGGEVVAARLDVGDSATISALADLAVTRFGALDIWVNNAALYPSVPLLETDDGLWDQVMAVNLRGLFVGCREAARRMIEAGKGGVIVNVASQAGLRGVVPGLAAYATSKHGVVGATRQLSIELAPHGIRVLGVAPSHARTEKTAIAIAANPELLEQIPALSTSRLGRVGVPDDVGRVVLFCASDLSLFMTGSTLAVDAGEMA